MERAFLLVLGRPGRPRPALRSSSERHAYTQLHAPHVPGRADLAERRGRVERRPGVRQVDEVQYIGGFEAELQRRAAREAARAADPEIHIAIARTVHEVPRGGAVAADARQGEGRGVKPLLDDFIARTIG